LPFCSEQRGLVRLLFTLAVLLGACLVFLVEPLFARLALPLLGGSPAVWNTAMVFYQVALLAGYLYAHASQRWLTGRVQVLLHATLLLASFGVLPLGIPPGWLPPTDGSPQLWLLLTLLLRVGLPFGIVSATSPLLQNWFARTGHRQAHDPYFLYSASNLGSMLGLLAYPLLIEPALPLSLQSSLWTAAYGALVVLLLACGVIRWRAQGRPQVHQDRSIAASPLTLTRRLKWVFWAFIPSSLMLSVTTYLSTDLAPVPLLWMVPLGTYLLSFIIVFAERPVCPSWIWSRLLPIVLLPLTITLLLSTVLPLWLLIPFHLAALLIVSLVAHGRLANDRPAAGRLTEFYLWMSVGGALGGIFNALLAPQIFPSVTEYPVGLVLAALLVEGSSLLPVSRRDLLWPALAGAFVWAAFTWIPEQTAGWVAVKFTLVFIVPILVIYRFSRRPVRFALALGALLLAATPFVGERQSVLTIRRSFYGVNSVRLDPRAGLHVLYHGDTAHGAQSTDPARACVPLAYYHTASPIGQVLESRASSAVAVVGLGTGSLAPYARPEQAWTFFEIDPEVERLARDPQYFTFLERCAPQAQVVLGDARLSIRNAPEHSYDLIVLDAYSSDAIPVHLITREAVTLYLSKLRPGGLLAFHISNRYLDLEPVLADLAENAGLVARLRLDDEVDALGRAEGKKASRWAILAAEASDLGELVEDVRWQPLKHKAGSRLWTDDYSSVVSVLR
jgi:SAM-dependent methyltransferase